jgi:hypothetical protein
LFEEVVLIVNEKLTKQSLCARVEEMRARGMESSAAVAHLKEEYNRSEEL